MHALSSNTNIGSIRETFFCNQLLEAGHEVNLAKKETLSLTHNIRLKLVENLRHLNRYEMYKIVIWQLIIHL